MNSLMYFGVKNTRLRSLNAAQLTITGADLGLRAGVGSQSIVVICHSTYEPSGGGGRHMCRSTYTGVNISRLLILQSLLLVPM